MDGSGCEGEGVSAAEPMIVITGQMIRLQVWTPFTAMAEGNWSPLVLVALAL